MESRKSALKSPIADVDNLPSYQFCSIIKSFINPAAMLLQNQRIFGMSDGMETLRLKFQAVTQAVSALEILTAQEEDARQPYVLSAQLLELETREREAYEAAKKKLDEYRIEFDQTKTDLILKESQLSNDIEIFNTHTAKDIIERKTKMDQELDDLKNKGAILQRQYDDKETKINRKCCAHGSKKEKQDLQDLLDQIKANADSMSRLLEQKNKVDDQEHEGQLLQEKLKEARAKLDKLINANPRREQRYQDAVEAAEIRLEEIKIQNSEAAERYHYKISRLLMFKQLRVYYLFMELNKSVDLFNMQELGEKSKRKQRIAQLSNQITTTKEKIEALLTRLWCVDIENKTGMDIVLEHQDGSQTNKFIDTLNPSEQELDQIFPVMRRKSVLMAASSRLFSNESGMGSPVKTNSTNDVISNNIERS